MNRALVKITPGVAGLGSMRSIVAVAQNEFQLMEYCEHIFKMPCGQHSSLHKYDSYYIIENFLPEILDNI